MQNNVSTNVVKLDLQTILAHFREPKFWQKKWTIIDTPSIKVVWYITHINCEYGKINSMLKVTHKDFHVDGKDFKDSDWWNEGVDLPVIPIDNKDYTQEHFNRALYGRLKGLLNDVERHMIYSYEEYKNAEKLEATIKDKLYKIAYKFLDDSNITSDAIRSAYADAYVKDTFDKDTSNYYTVEVIDNYQYKVITESYIYAAAWFNNQEDYEKFSDILKEERKSIQEDIWAKCREIQNDSWNNSMKEQLKQL